MTDLPETLRIKVIPKARQACIKEEKAADDSYAYKVYVTAAPESGKANEAVIKLLAKTFGISKSSLTLVRGATGQLKTFKFQKQ